MEGPVGQYVAAPAHLRGARVVGAEWLDVDGHDEQLVLTLDRPHPAGPGRLAVPVVEVLLAPLPPALLGARPADGLA